MGWDFERFPYIQGWVKECSALPGAAENDEGAKQFGEAVRSKLK